MVQGKSLYVIMALVGVIFLQVIGGMPHDNIVSNIYGNIISRLWTEGRAEFLGMNCRFSTCPTFHKWKLHYKGKFWCPGFAPFTGKSITLSRSGAVEHATRDFAQKAFAEGLVDEEDVKIWLKN